MAAIQLPRLFKRAARVDPADGQPAPPFPAVVEALPDPLMLVAGEPGQAPRLLLANAAARALLHMPRAGGPLAAVLRRPEVLEAADLALWERTEQNVVYESGDRIWRVTATPLTQVASAEGERTILLLMRDETDARRNARMRADFLANASHELKTPLASIAGFIETLQGPARDDAPARDRFLKIMAGQAARMIRLVDDLLALSRIELDEHLPPTGEYDIAQAASEVIEALAPVAAARAVRVKLTRDGPARAQGSRDQLIQVAQNLIENALKYSPESGEVRIRVFGPAPLEAIMTADRQSPRTVANGGGRLALITPEPEPGRLYIGLEVADDGLGMERTSLPRLTERFYRVEGQKSVERGGTGLGLAIVKHIVNRHQGALTVESAPGLGSVFTVGLPSAPAASTASTAVDAAVE
jgi:two-component system phosphate regulon sensor histidine kinase PhoR